MRLPVVGRHFATAAVLVAQGTSEAQGGWASQESIVCEIKAGLFGLGRGLGAGALLAAVAYKLVAEAGRLAGGSGYVGVGLIGGAVATAWVVAGAVSGRRLSEPPVHEPSSL